MKNPVSLTPDFFMENIFKTSIETPIGYLELSSNHDFLLSVSFVENLRQQSDYLPNILNETTIQLREYFKGIRKAFNLNLQPSGTEFQMKVWDHVANIQFGETISYLEIAKLTGSKNNTRAVGLANGKNPIPIIIPCHRVIGANEKLIGYAGGLDRKIWLLKHEFQNSNSLNRLF
jgi:methylated-DNA-[protein]-cysteine S-methyltransferase